LILIDCCKKVCTTFLLNKKGHFSAQTNNKKECKRKSSQKYVNHAKKALIIFNSLRIIFSDIGPKYQDFG
jgi:hypothetical protein